LLNIEKEDCLSICRRGFKVHVERNEEEMPEVYQAVGQQSLIVSIREETDAHLTIVQLYICKLEPQ